MAATGPKLKFFKTATVSDRSPVLVLNSLLPCVHLLFTRIRATSCWKHVDAYANPAEGGGRQGMSCKLAKQLGIPREWIKFPFVSACLQPLVPQSG